MLRSLVVLLVAAVLFPAISIAQPLPDMAKDWRLQTGDDPKWADPDLDDSPWRAIKVGMPWDSQGLSEHDGYAWLRRSFSLPESLKEDENFKRFGALKLILGKIDDVDRTFFNGQVVGETGTFPEGYSGNWTASRVYTIPGRLIRWDAPNVIAVRVYDREGLGGMYEGPYGLRTAAWQDYLTLDLDLGAGDGLFDEGKRLPIASFLSNDTGQNVEGTLKWHIEDDEGNFFGEEEVDLVLNQGERTRATYGGGPTEPGFYRVRCTFETADKEFSRSTSLVMGFRPEEIRRPLTREEDFDAFWQETLNALAAVDPEFVMTPRPDRGTETHEVFEIEMRSLGDVRVRGWYEKPKGQGVYPAHLRVPGYTSTMWPEGRPDPVAVFSFNIRAHGNSQDDVSGTPEDYWVRGLDDKQGYYYQGAYADCVRAVDFLASRPEVDSSRIAVSGGSQGGGLSIATAALDKRIKLCAPDIPFMCNWVNYFKASDWPEITNWVAAKPGHTWEKMLQTMSYFDAMNLAGRITVPVFMGAGLQDPVCPPGTVFAMYNRLEGPKDFRIYPQAGHWVESSHNDERQAWILEKFGIEE